MLIFNKLLHISITVELTVDTHVPEVYPYIITVFDSFIKYKTAPGGWTPERFYLFLSTLLSRS